jgi:hypothetical protein
MILNPNPTPHTPITLPTQTGQICCLGFLGPLAHTIRVRVPQVLETLETLTKIIAHRLARKIKDEKIWEKMEKLKFDCN